MQVGATMDRRAWLAERRAATVAEYDAEAATYEAHAYPVEAHRRFVARLLDTCPPGGVVLDAPCGTGRYFPLVAAAGRRVVGIDQSAGMLAEARAKGIAESLQHVGLQELALEDAFDAVRGGRPSLRVGCRDLDHERVAGPEVHAEPVDLPGPIERRADRARECRVLDDVSSCWRLVAGLDDRRRVRRDGRRGDEESEHSGRQDREATEVHIRNTRRVGCRMGPPGRGAGGRSPPLAPGPHIR
jgi:SAM-dependent methyltransferase